MKKGINLYSVGGVALGVIAGVFVINRFLTDEKTSVANFGKK